MFINKNKLIKKYKLKVAKCYSALWKNRPIMGDQIGYKYSIQLCEHILDGIIDDIDDIIEDYCYLKARMFSFGIKDV